MGIVIHRSHHAQQYVVVPNSIARNATLSFRARGLLVMLLSLPPDWHVTTDMLAEDTTEGRDPVRRAMAELRNAGYVEVHREQGGKGRWRTRLEVFDTPATERDPSRFRRDQGKQQSSQVAPNAGQPAAGLPAPKKSTGPKYGAEVREDQNHSVANPEDHRVHDGPQDPSSDDQQSPIPVTLQSPAADRNARTRGAP